MGEDSIVHTPKDETLNLKIGHAFDVVSEHKQFDFQKINDRTFESEYEVTIRTHKTTAVTVEVNEPIGGDWSIVRSTHRWTKADAWTTRYNVAVASDSQAVVRYRVRVTY